jgi:hypothetical protein
MVWMASVCSMSPSYSVEEEAGISLSEAWLDGTSVEEREDGVPLSEAWLDGTSVEREDGVPLSEAWLDGISVSSWYEREPRG